MRPLRRPRRGAVDAARATALFRLLAGGATVKAIAGGLGVSVRTISTYRARFLEKMRLETNADLTQYALHHRLIG